MLVLLHAIPPDGFCSSLLRRPHLPHGARHLFWVLNISVDLAPQRDRDRLGFIVTHSHLWPVANGAHAYVFAYPCFGWCRPYCNQISRSEAGQTIHLSASLFGCRILFGCRLLYSAVGFSIRLLVFTLVSKQ